MPYEITATRKRPQTFDDLAGQDFVSTTLRASIASGRIAHAYLFSGPRGCGKTSTARILARSLNCERGPTDKPCGACDSCLSIAKGSSLDVIEIDGASNTSVENVRQIKDEVLFPPNSSKYKIYIIDEVHMLSNSAFNALLKTIEEPPPYIVFIFATTELHKVPATIKSRCQQFNFRLFSLDVIKGLLRSAADDIGVEADDDALLWIAREATGSMRDAYTLFDQVASFSDGRITAAKIRDKLGLVGSERMGALMGLCAAGDRKAALETLDAILDSGVSVEQFASDAVSYARSLLLLASGVERESLLGAPRSSFPAALTEALDAPRLERVLSGLFDLYRDMRYSVNPRWELELAVSRLCAIRDYVPPAELSRTVRDMKAAIVDGKAPGAAAVGSALRDVAGRAPSSAGPGAEAARAAPAAASSAEPDVERLDEEPDRADPRATAASSSEADAIDTAALRASLLAAVGKNRVVLSTCLERSGEWVVEGDKLVIHCQNGYDAGAVLADAGLLAKKALDITGRPLRIEPRAAEPAPTPAPPARSGDDDDTDDGDDGPADPVGIVEKVFRGRRVSAPAGNERSESWT
ncbi:MAG TPA: DNA polymerase III subunit gamma/tau [Spirochaetia bacterium]|nr:DNA polymerase III subunit gamma/tau [Spirochaetaceae bacterium]HPE88519.1 DNA polymerase III subunit gamma/tau [Spirochaetales bacterium]HRW23186.1 DNA polymerase III subunit gamma/tau [Spirochaetia bacterium]